MGVPVGFDTARLLVNVPAIDTVRKIAGLGMVSVLVQQSKPEDMWLGIGSVDSNGAASVGAVGTQQHKKSATGNVTFPINSFFDLADATIKIDGSWVQDKLDASSTRNAPFDPTERAGIYNKALRRGLYEAAFAANIDKSKMLVSSCVYLPMVAVGVMLNSIAGPIIMAASAPLGSLMAIAASGRDNTELTKKALHHYRQSMFIGCAPDRYLAAAAVIGTNRFIKARA